MPGDSQRRSSLLLPPLLSAPLLLPWASSTAGVPRGGLPGLHRLPPAPQVLARGGVRDLLRGNVPLPCWCPGASQGSRSTREFLLLLLVTHWAPLTVCLRGAGVTVASADCRLLLLLLPLPAGWPVDLRRCMAALLTRPWPRSQAAVVLLRLLLLQPWLAGSCPLLTS